MRRSSGQTMLEYAVFVAVVAGALVGMGTYVQRAIRANVKNTETEINASACEEPAPTDPTVTPTRPEDCGASTTTTP